MAVYALDTSQNATNFINSLETALTNAGLLETVYQKTTTRLTCKLTRSPKVMDFWGNYCFECAWGDSYDPVAKGIVGGGLLIEQGGYAEAPNFGNALIVTPDIVSIVTKNTFNNRDLTNCYILGKFTNGDEFIFGGTNNKLSNIEGYGFYNTTNYMRFIIPSQKFDQTTPVIDSLGNLYTKEIVMMNRNQILMPELVCVGLKAVYRASVYTTPSEVHGNHVLVPLGYFPKGLPQAPTSGTNQNFTGMIINGNI